MTAHSVHPSIRENGLSDDCPRCYEHGQYPFEGLDDENLFYILVRVIDHTPSRSINEGKAMDVVRQVRRQHSRLVSVIKKIRPDRNE